jgi:predicted PurR-regulated permease PerM
MRGAGRAHVGVYAVVIVAAILVALAIHILRGLLAPLLAAAFLLVVIGGLSRVLRNLRPGLPRPISMGAAVIIILLCIAGAVWISINNITALAEDAEAYITRLSAASSRLGELFGEFAPNGVESLFGSLNPTRMATLIAGWLQVALTSTGFTLIYLGFMMASGRTFKRKLAALAGSNGGGVKGAHATYEQIREAVGSYIWVQTATGLMIAGLSWGLLSLFEIPSPIFWAFVIFVTSYVPIIGGVAGVFLPVIFSVAVAESFQTPALLFVGLQAIQVLIGNIVQPRMQSASLNIDPVVVLLGLGLWGALLGPIGAFLSTPLTVTAMVMLGHFPETKWIAILLSADGRPKLPNKERTSQAPTTAT